MNLKRPDLFTASRVTPLAIVSLELIVRDGCIEKTFLMMSMIIGILVPPPTSSIESICIFLSLRKAHCSMRIL